VAHSDIQIRISENNNYQRIKSTDKKTFSGRPGTLGILK
jgi:hypothetical protein